MGMSKPRLLAENTCLHAGWALMGQECDCGHFPNLNWLARTIGEGEWDDEHDRPISPVRRRVVALGSRLVRMGERVGRGS